MQKLNDKKKQIRYMKNARQKKILETIRNEISSEKRKQNDVNLNLGTGASSWLTTFLIKEEWYILNKQSFWALLSVRYNRRLKRVPNHCARGNTFNLQHALRHLKVGLVILRHNYSKYYSELVNWSLQSCPCRNTIAAVEWWNIFQEDCE